MTPSVHLTITTWLRYLVGSRRAIATIMQSRQALWLGGLLVISAGFAREYDGEDLLREPWHILIPAGVSTIAAGLLFALLVLITLRYGGPWRFELTFPGLLALYWLMAPMAWLYAIPAERFLSPAEAVRTNLSLLACVSLWRVLLMTRVVAVVLHRNFFAALFPVMLFADAVALVAIQVSPKPIFDIMSGIRLTEGEQVLLDAVLFVNVLGVLSFPFWLVGTMIMVWKQEAPEESEMPDPIKQASVSRSLAALGVMSIVMWVGVLPFTQDEQWNREQVERLMAAERIDEALTFMSQRIRSDFPPHWDYPPRIGYRQLKPSLTDVVIATKNDQVAPWVKKIYQDKFTYYNIGHSRAIEPMPFRPEEMPDDELERYVQLLLSLPNGQEIASNHAANIGSLLNSNDIELSPRRRELLVDLYELSGKTL